MKKLTMKALILYAICNFGWSLGFYNVNNLLNYFYIPNLIDGNPMFPIFIPNITAILGLTILGLIIGSGRIVDAITDPIIAHISDNMNHPKGKRRFFMLISSFPLALFGLLAFYPPFMQATVANGVYLFFILVLFYIALTAYVVPCSALVGELGSTKTERLNLSTASSVGWALGFAFGNTIYVFQSMFEAKGCESFRAFQYAIIIFSVVAFCALFIPAYFIKETNIEKTSKTPIYKELRVTIKNKNLRVFLLSEMSYWFALTFIQTGISYYIVTLLGIEKSFATVAMMIVFLGSFLFYVPINLLARKIGKKKMELIGFVVLAMAYTFVLLLGKVPIEPKLQILCVSVIASVPMGIFGIMPYAIISDLAEQDGRKTGNYKTGMFYAFRGLFMKIGTSLAGLLFPTIIIWGRGVINPFGIRLTGVFGIVFCLIGFILMTQYQDNF